MLEATTENNVALDELTQLHAQRHQCLLEPGSTRHIRRFHMREILEFFAAVVIELSRKDLEMK